MNFISLSISECHLINLWLGERHHIQYRSDSSELEGKGKWLLIKNVQPENIVEHMLGGSFLTLGGWLGPGKRLTMETDQCWIWMGS